MVSTPGPETDLSSSGTPQTRRVKTPDAIIEVAEDLWGTRGLDAVSLREISTAAGLSNPASVQYHFGSKDSLIRAIFEKRLPVIDSERESSLAVLRADGQTENLVALLDCLFRPLFDQRNAGGRHSYAAFLHQVLQSPYAVTIRGKAMDLTPVTEALLALIHVLLPPLSPALRSQRMIAVNLLMLNMIARFDQEPPADLSAEAIYRDVLGMCAHALMHQPEPC